MTPAADPILERLSKLHPKKIDLSLGRIERLLGALGHPQMALPPVLHVAGTNGKGSVVAFLRAIFEAAGYRVHTYTSPHLVRFNERICLAGQPIAEDVLVRLLEICEAANGKEAITFFEITTAAAFLAFAQAKAQGDVLLLETGLGGRLDATNLVARPRLCVLTPIGIDHVQFLGPALEGIAAEKAAILKPGVPAVVGLQTPEAAAIIAARAQGLAVPLLRAGQEWAATATPEGMTYREGDLKIPLPLPALAGDHQIENAGIAVAAARAAGFLIPETALAAGLKNVTWPARLQRLCHGPLAALLLADGELWLDGGHNVAAAAALGRWAAASARPVSLVIGMMEGKDPTGFLRHLSPYVDRLCAVPIEGHAALSPKALVTAAHQAGIERAVVADSPAAAIAQIVGGQIVGGQMAGAPAPRILIAGSLYLAGNVLGQMARV